ncbi:MAG: succinate dehydrogenase assembly factor 2 [Alphaproteobacteria bacterium]|nr:succinate dehydrogenase assembly factor 2 [Alphaproteobacteria bacterium]
MTEPVQAPDPAAGAMVQTIELRRKRLYFQAQHRGCREADLVIGGFAEAAIAGLSPTELDELEAILEADDGLVLRWLLGVAPVEAGYSQAMIDRMVAAKTCR